LARAQRQCASRSSPKEAALPTRMFQEIRNTDFVQILPPAGLGDVVINLERQHSRVVGYRLECGLAVATVTVNIVGSGGVDTATESVSSQRQTRAAGRPPGN
jgi:imidazole glycerol phosphate synthase subunit HisF